MVGTGRFELPTPRTPSECSTRLSHVPTTGVLQALVYMRNRTEIRCQSPVFEASSVARWDVFLRQVGTLTKEVLRHLFDQEFLGLRGPRLEAVFVE